MQIGSLQAGMRGFSPEIILKDIQVLNMDTQAEPAIQLAEIRLNINLIKLLSSGQLLASSQLTLVGMKLSIVRKKGGALSIIGLNSNDSKSPYWLLEKGQYQVLKSDITWLDEQTNAPPVEFSKVDLLIKNDTETLQHEIHLISQLPQQYGQSLRISISLKGSILDRDNINAMVYVEGKEINLTKLWTEKQWPELEIVKGKASFNLWSQWNKSTLASVMGSIQGKNLMLHKQNKDLKIVSLKTKFNGFIDDDNWKLEIKDFNLKTETKHWSNTKLSISGNKTLTQLAGFIGQLDLQELTLMMPFFAWEESKIARLISKFALKGLLKDFSFYTEKKNKQLAVNGHFENIFMQAYAGFPQLENLTGAIQATHDDGLIAFKTYQGSLFFPKLFKAPFSLHQLTGLLAWQQMADKWQISSESMVLNNKNIQTETKIALSIPKNDAPVFMDLQTYFANVEMSHIADYYPVSIMDKETLNWLDNAFVAGKIRQGNVLVYGELNDFPFLEGQGVFETMFNIEELELQYNPDWPNLNHVAAKALFLKDSLSIKLSNAELGKLNIGTSLIEIPFFSNNHQLLWQGTIAGRIIDGLKFFQQTPLHASVDAILKAITPKGFTQVELNLKIPFTETEPVEFTAITDFDKVALQLNAIDLPVTEISGELKLTEQGLFSKQILAKALGFPITVAINNEDFNTTIDIKGKAEVSQLKQQSDFFNHALFSSDSIKGSTEYNVTVKLPIDNKQATELNISSNLLGISVNLPSLLKKTATQKSSLELKLLLNNNDLMPLSINYNKHLKAAIRLHKQDALLHSAHIVYGDGQAIEPQFEGIKIQVETNKFDLSEWLKFIKTNTNNQQTTEFAVKNMGFKINQLLWQNKNLGSFSGNVKWMNERWQGNIECAYGKGLFILPSNTKGGDKINLNLSHLNLSALKKINIKTTGMTNKDVPLIKLKSEHLWWNEKDLGQFEIETEHLSEGIRFKPINITSNDYQIKFKADWLRQNKTSVTEIQGDIVSNNVGAFLSTMDITNDFKETTGKLEYFGSWSNLPHQFSLADMQAEIAIELKDGRILSIQPGVGRILGLLAIEQWVKRLTLDFSDIYKQGLSFNRIAGHFKVNNGMVINEDLLIDAVPAHININGKTDLLTKIIDYDVKVVPKSSAALPVAGTIIDGVTDTIISTFTDGYKDGYFFGSQYKVTGHWDNIKVTTLHDQSGVLTKKWMELKHFFWPNSDKQ